MELHEQTIAQLRQLIFKGELSPADLNAALWKRIDDVEGRVLSYITLMRESAVDQAKKIGQTRANDHELLTGIPIALKDNMTTVGTPTTCASRILATYNAPYNASIVDRLERAGSIFVGKTNMDEFAMGSSTENSAMHVTHNPWNLDCVPGGSSGGSAAAVAAGEAVAALGSDTGGSIRQPASFCGVVGMKPTYGRVSRYGLVAFASSLDQIGPITKDVRDCAIMMQALAGHDPKDSTSVNRPVPDYAAVLTGDIKGMRFGVIKELMGDGIEKNVKEAVKKAIDKISKLGGKIVEVSLPSFEHALSCYYLIAPSEASSNLARYDGAHYGYRDIEAKDLLSMYMQSRDHGFGPEVKRRIMIGTYALSAGYYDAYYRKAQQVRTLIRQDFDKAFSKADVLITPTCPTVAFKIGEKTNDPVAMYLSDIATIPVNMAGVPAMSIPCGFHDGLPIGLQLIGRLFEEETILRAAFAYEQNTEWHTKRAKL